MLVKLRAAGRSVVEVGVPHYPRTAGSATGAKAAVVLRAVRDFWLLRLRLWANRTRAMRRGEPLLDPTLGLRPPPSPGPRTLCGGQRSAEPLLLPGD